MTYWQEERLVIRTMEPEDGPELIRGEQAQGYHTTEAKFHMRLRDQAEGRSIALTAVHGGLAVGYIHVYRQAADGPFAGAGIPEIVDFGVLEKYRCRGIGSRLMDTAEGIARELAPRVCLGVGLHQGYGAAQRLYVKRGYIPDGSGVWYREEICQPYGPCTNDDSLVLYLSKQL